ncbi:hypothetical protein H310_00061 [Aphanomyces invadans]|uniref:Prolyl endopeptidase-like n=1 Tax=Aphanomyces invadans TaxID=157072 RepID=A0A024USK1_9STRA|nr:hypothetical protein H310_00061 [Aphanomyces invadans]ETW09491.1 hypothetical protein H310_00061 [Aphanomyces invadans]|eukprot:XP_008860902.1 hypothetical protein H310_00061 [Aphanomyces invadans]
MGVAPPAPRRKRDGVKKKAKPVKKTNVTSIDALVVHKTKLTPADEAMLFESNKSALSHERFTRAIYSVISQYHQAYIDWYPYDPKSYERQGYSEFHLENYAKAVERLSQAVYLGANSAKMWRTLGRACFHLWKQTHDWGLLWDAKSCFENGLRFVEVAMNPYALFEYSHVLEGLGEFGAALGVVRTLLYSFPQFAKADHVVLRAVVLMFHTVVFNKQQGQNDAATNDKARQDMLDQCCDYCKFIIDKDVSKTDMYLTLLYVTARVHEAAVIPRTVKYAAKTYEELYRVGLRLGIVTPIVGCGWLEWFRSCTTWSVWVQYFDKRDDLILAVDAAQEGIKRIDVAKDRVWNRATFSWEPEATMWYTLGNLFFKCNDMIPAVAAMETSLYFGRYRTDVRDKVTQWHPTQWSSPLASEISSQVKIAALLRGVWGRDKAKRHKVWVIQDAMDQYRKSPYTSLRARKVLVKFMAETYAPKFAAQDVAARRIQKIGKRFALHMRIFYTNETNRQTRLDAIIQRWAVAPFDRLLRDELALLSPTHRAMFARQHDAAVRIQSLQRGRCARYKYFRLLTEDKVLRSERLRVYNAACRIQRRFRTIRSNALLHTRHILRHKKERLAVNLQRLYRRKKSLLVRFLQRQAQRKQDEARNILRRGKCVKIQTWWRRRRAAWMQDEPINEASFLLERLLRGHDALMKDEKDLDFYARRIQALYRGRQDRLCLRGLRRVRMPPVPSIVHRLIQEAHATGRGNVAVLSDPTAPPLTAALRDMMHRRHATMVVAFQAPPQPATWSTMSTMLKQGGGAAVETLLVGGGSRIRGTGMSALVEALRGNQLKHLRVLGIGRNEIVADGPGCMPCRDLSTCLQTAHFQLRHLIVEDNNLTDVGAMHVASAIGDYFFGRYGHLERLVLGRVGLTDAACQAFGQALSINTVLRTLDLHGNRIHDEGASALATGFHKSRTLQTLDLSENGVGTVGAKALFRAMETSAVMNLVLLNNNVKNDVMGALAALLKAKDQGCVVDLHGNLIHADNMVEIQTWFTPECPDEAIQLPLVPNGTAFDEAKRKLFAPRNAKGVGKLSKDPLKELRRERRAIPLARTPNSVSHLLKLPAEHAHWRRESKPYRKFQRALYAEMRERLKLDQADHSIPETIGDHTYYIKSLPRLNFPLYCRQHVKTAKEEVLLNPNDMDDFGQIGVFKVSPDGQFLAYTMDPRGDELYDAYVKDLRTSRTIKLQQHARSIEWDTVGSLYYTVPDAMHRPSRVFRYRHNSGSLPDTLVFEEHNPSVYVDVVLTKDNRYVLINANSKRSSEVHTLDAADAAAVPQLLRPRDPDVLYFADHATDAFYIVTNDNHASNYKVVVMPDSRRGHWTDFLAHTDAKGTKIDEMDLFKDFLVLYERQDGLPRVRVVPLRAPHEAHVLALPPEHACCVLHPCPNRQFDDNIVRFSLSTPLVPEIVYQYNLHTRHLEVLKEDAAVNFNAAQFTCRRVYVDHAAGMPLERRTDDASTVSVPMTLVHHKDLVLDGCNPTLLVGYGAYGINLETGFDMESLSLLERGWVLAYAHVRGGGELGLDWHTQGRCLLKKNSFVDFAACCRHLAKSGITTPSLLAAKGTSAGGLLVGVVANDHPELVRALVMNVPFLDIAATMQDPSLPLTVHEYDEWGNPSADAAVREYIESYSPIDNLRPLSAQSSKDYPAMFVTTALNDMRVNFWEPLRWVRHFRQNRTNPSKDGAPVVLWCKVSDDGGHFNGLGRLDQLQAAADEVVFLHHALQLPVERAKSLLI